MSAPEGAPPRLLTPALLARIAVRAGLLLLVAWPVASLLAGLYLGVTLAAATLVERLAVVRALRRGRAAWRAGLEASLGCALLFAVAALNAVGWLGAAGFDLQVKAQQVQDLLLSERGLQALGLSWLAAGPFGSLAMTQASGSPRDQPTGSTLLWALVWPAPLAPALLAQNGVGQAGPALALGAIVAALGLVVLCGHMALQGLDPLADPLARRLARPPTPSGGGPAA